MKKHGALILFLSTLTLLTSQSCNKQDKIELTGPSDKAEGQNVVTARLVWVSDCDSFDVYLGPGSDLQKVSTVSGKGL